MPKQVVFVLFVVAIIIAGFFGLYADAVVAVVGAEPWPLKIACLFWVAPTPARRIDPWFLGSQTVQGPLMLSRAFSIHSLSRPYHGFGRQPHIAHIWCKLLK
jgi:hypothetical protein